MVPKEHGFNQSEKFCFRLVRVPRVTFSRLVCHVSMDCEVIQRQHFCHHGDTICHPKSGYVITKLHGTSTCGCSNNAIFSGRAIVTLPAVVVCRPR